MNAPRSCRAVSPLLALLALGGTAWAQSDTEGPPFRFNPSVGLGYSVTNNVSYLEDPTNTSPGDTSAQLTAHLPVERRFRTGMWDLQYLGTWTRYGDNGSLDNGAHYLDTTYSFRLARRSSLAFTGVYARTQQQAVARAEPDFVTGDVLFLGERQELQAYGAGASYSFDLGPTWSWDVAVSAAQANASPIQDYQDDTTGIPRTDTRSYQARTSFERERSERFTLGGQYQFSRYDSGTELEDVNQLSVTWSRKLGRRSTLSGELGGYHRARDSNSATDYTTTGVLAALSYSYTPATGLVTRVGYSIAPTSGGTLQGTSTNRTLQAFVTGSNERRRLQWEFGGYRSVRDASDQTVPTLTALSVTGSIEHALRALMGLRLQTNWVDQSSDVQGYSEGRYYSVALSCVFYPLGKARIAGGSGASIRTSSHRSRATGKGGAAGATGVGAGAASSATLVDRFVIGAEDRLDISVWGHPEVSRPVTVRMDGGISLPLIQDVRVVGKTPEEVGGILEREFSGYFNEEVSVAVIVEQVRSFRVYFVGAVKTPGMLTFERPMRLLQALAAAGGPTDEAQGQITLIRESAGVEQRFDFDYERLLDGDPGQGNPYLQPGDTLLVR